MNKSELLFYDAYEQFYEMAKTSKAFAGFCKEAFDEDFSQDGFSDRQQIDGILKYIPDRADVHILDIGCGNGKMLGYLQKKTGAYIHGFDYSENAIATAKTLYQTKAEFWEGVMGEIEYDSDAFDVITSMDTMYFAKDMTAFVGQIKSWLKPDGILYVGYQEGDVLPKTENVDTTELAKALTANGMKYEVTDITEQVYELLRKKRAAAMKYKTAFEQEGNKMWYEMLVAQTEYASVSLEEFKEKMARYIYVVRND